MKEYLTKNSSGNYQLVNHRFSEDDIAVPEGAEAFTECMKHGELFQLWWKGECKICVGYDDDWFNIQRDTEDYLRDEKEAVIVWQRETLNDKIASAEVARQKTASQWDLQVGGDHYKSMKIQPAKFALENKLDYCQANAIKYICRHASKNGKQDLEKAKHYIDLLIEHYYGDSTTVDW